MGNKIVNFLKKNGDSTNNYNIVVYNENGDNYTGIYSICLADGFRYCISLKANRTLGNIGCEFSVYCNVSDFLKNKITTLFVKGKHTIDGEVGEVSFLAFFDNNGNCWLKENSLYKYGRPSLLKAIDDLNFKYDEIVKTMILHVLTYFKNYGFKNESFFEDFNSEDFKEIMNETSVTNDTKYKASSVTNDTKYKASSVRNDTEFETSFEYMIVFMGRNREGDLNGCGKDGWEAVSVYKYEGELCCLMKRRY